MSLFDLLHFRKAAHPSSLRADPTGVPSLPAGSPPSSVDPGIAFASVADLLAREDELLNRFRYCYGTDPATFDRDILAPIRAYAAYVNLLPATPDNFFCSAGGLFRLGLEVAFFALQGTDAHIVSGRATISVRKELEPRWRQATFLAGLCSELHRTLSQLVVTDERGNEWPCYLSPLTQWLEQHKTHRFHVRWISKAPESRGLSLFALPHIVTPQAMQHLAHANNTVVPQMLASITGIPVCHEPSIIADLVKRSAALVIDRDLAASARRYGKPILGAHLERYLLDAMRRLVASHPAWSPNTERSRVWFTEEGLFIVWPNAAHEIYKTLEDDALPAIPKSPETIVEILAAAGVLQAPSTETDLWTILPPGASSPIQAIRLVSPDVLLAGQFRQVQPLKSRLVATNAIVEPSIEAGASHRILPQTSAIDQGADSPTSFLTGEAETNPAAFSDCPPVKPAAPSAQSSPPQASAEVAERSPHLSLRAPMRLVPQARLVLTQAIDSLNGPAEDAVAVIVPRGVFVPLQHFKDQQIDPSIVLRSLAELDMIVGTEHGRPRTFQHNVRGAEQTGVVLKPAHVLGLNLHDFQGAG